MLLKTKPDQLAEINRKVKQIESDIHYHESEIDDLEGEIAEHQSEIDALEDEIEDLENELDEIKNAPAIIIKSDPSWYKATYQSPLICPECSNSIPNFFKNIMSFPGDDQTRDGEAYEYSCHCGAIGEFFKTGQPFEYILALTGRRTVAA